MPYIPLHVHSHYSLLDGLSKPDQIADRCKELGIKSCAITDHGNICGAIQFYQKMKKAGIKPILGVELYICKEDALVKTKENAELSHMVVLCKNYKGWKTLIELVSRSNSSEFFYYKPRLSLKDLAEFDCSNLICITGHPGSVIADDILDGEILKDDATDILLNKINELNKIFGSDNVFLECQLMDQDINPVQKTLTEFYRKIGNNINLVATCDAHYCKKEDAVDQRILLCNNLKTTFSDINQKLINNEKFGMDIFFKSDNYHILSNEEMEALHSEIELSNTIKISNMIEEYDILSNPRLPPFSCPNGISEHEYLTQITKQKLVDLKLGKEYSSRLDQELTVLKEAKLAGYFLIVRDIIDYIKSNNWLPGPGRGSAAGCLISYLLGITSIDPIKYDLIFERFYNSGRNTSERISMPDIDVDVPIDKRESVIDYIKQKYGSDKVSQMITFNTLKGRGALKEVLRVYGNISFEETNRITENIPDEAKIADELQEMKEEYGEASIIRWALENNSEKLKQWCYVGDSNQLAGPLAKRFEQAIRLEGTKCHQSKHAAGVAISALGLNELCPMIHDTKTGQNIAGLEMGDLESLGIVKFDILGVALLDKIMQIRDFLVD
jgi:DNA polymerase-3 subunit alpha